MTYQKAWTNILSDFARFKEYQPGWGGIENFVFGAWL